MRAFTKTEIRVTVIIFLITFAVTYFNLRIALRRSRDAQRRADIGAISDAVNSFHTDYGFFPPSENGKVKICKGPNFDEVLQDLTDDTVFDRNKLIAGLVVCEWGKSEFVDVLGSGKVYLPAVPVDPRQNLGMDYLYLSDTEYYQVYSYLEGGASEDTYNPKVVGRGLPCGSKICSYGKSYLDIPLEMSIEDYRFQLEKTRIQK